MGWYDSIMSDVSHVCPVCGYPGLSGPPRHPNGGGSYEICPSCGFEFGVTDEDRGFSYDHWRRIWVAIGMPWWRPYQPPPKGWNPELHLSRIIDALEHSPEEDYALSARSHWLPGGADFLRSLPFMATRAATDRAAAKMEGRIVCPVCGYPGLSHPPTEGESVDGATEVCPSCGFQFGVTDAQLGISYDEWRRYWSAQGWHWVGGNAHPEPEGWHPAAQLRAYLESLFGKVDDPR
jgi:predicted RNA-binding Zn-ribbon protein involved in translation (DUF1610 family)